ncbi:hypothetical protein FRB94_007709 [Tulasnella sp. JGI-2019a]|nr:hypothetical protein FRB94_007709 [Tulasnella sp. JGI-2019a]
MVQDPDTATEAYIKITRPPTPIIFFGDDLFGFEEMNINASMIKPTVRATTSGDESKEMPFVIPLTRPEDTQSMSDASGTYIETTRPTTPAIAIDTGDLNQRSTEWSRYVSPIDEFPSVMSTPKRQTKVPAIMTGVQLGVAHNPHNPINEHHAGSVAARTIIIIGIRDDPTNNAAFADR